MCNAIALASCKTLGNDHQHGILEVGLHLDVVHRIDYMRTLLPTYSGHWSDSRRERNLCHLQIISMLNCSGNKIPLICVFAAIAIVFIHGLSLAVAPSEPELREPDARAWATAEHEPARPKAGVVFLAYSNHCSRELAHCHRSSPIEVVYAGRLLKKIMKPAYPTLLFANKAPRDVHGAGAKASPVTLCTTIQATVAAVTKATNLVATTPETPVTRISSASVGRRLLPWARITRF